MATTTAARTLRFDVREIPFSMRGAWFDLSPVVALHTRTDTVHLVSHRTGMHAVLAFTPVAPGAGDVDATWEASPASFSWTASDDRVVEAVLDGPDRAARILALAGGDADKIVGPHVTQAAQEGDELATHLLAELGRWIGEGAASVAALLDPAMIVIGGGVAAAGDLVLEPARKGFGEQLSARGHRPEATIVVASMGNDAGIVGAADLARV